MRNFDFNFSPGFWILPFVLLAIAALVLTIWMLVDAIARPPEEFSSPGAKTGWIAGIGIGIFFGFGFIVAVVYLFVVRMPAKRRARHYSGPPTPGPGGGWAPPPPPASTAPPLNCRNCGAKLLAGARFCHSCGAVV